MTEVRFIEQGHEVLGIFRSRGFTEPHDFIATVARTCYKSEPRGSDADERLVRSLMRNDHGAMLEHSFMSVRFVTDRAIANEIVRHRHFSFAQESTRFVGYHKRGFEFILPGHLDKGDRDIMVCSCQRAAEDYEELTKNGCPPEMARAVLPLCTATRIVVSGNFREWRHFLRLRCDEHAHPQMRALAMPLLDELKMRVPVCFEDLS